jgi:hypothetical protein
VSIIRSPAQLLGFVEAPSREAGRCGSLGLRGRLVMTTANINGKADICGLQPRCCRSSRRDGLVAVRIDRNKQRRSYAL